MLIDLNKRCLFVFYIFSFGLIYGHESFLKPSFDPLYFSMRSFRKAPQDKGYRRDIEERIKQLPWQHPDSFYLFLEMYEEEGSSTDKMKIMRAYYEHFSVEKYRQNALLFLFSAYQPWNPVHNQLVFDFLREHLNELQVLEVFLYHCAVLQKLGNRISFVDLFHSLCRHVNDFSFPSLVSLLFFDAILSQEMHTKNYEQVRGVMLTLWQNEIRRQSSLYQDHRDIFRLINSFYNLATRRKDFPNGGYLDFIRQRERLFSDLGYSYTDVIYLLKGASTV